MEKTHSQKHTKESSNVSLSPYLVDSLSIIPNQWHQSIIRIAKKVDWTIDTQIILIAITKCLAEVTIANSSVFIDQINPL